MHNKIINSPKHVKTNDARLLSSSSLSTPVENVESTPVPVSQVPQDIDGKGDHDTQESDSQAFQMLASGSQSTEIDNSLISSSSESDVSLSDEHDGDGDGYGSDIESITDSDIDSEHDGTGFSNSNNNDENNSDKEHHKRKQKKRKRKRKQKQKYDPYKPIRGTVAGK